MAAVGLERSRLKAMLVRHLLGLHSRYATRRINALTRRVGRILATPNSPDCQPSEAAFDRLQAQHNGVPEYGYDPFSTWSRGAVRAQALVALSPKLKTPGARVLEAACGDGMTAYMVGGFGHEILLADADDWRDARARPLPFIKGDLTEPGVAPEGHFDLVYSFNSFEHFADPEAVLRHLVQACHPGGLLYLEFGPLYAGPWGLHAYRTLRMPYPQFLFSPEFTARKLESLGIDDLGGKRTSLQPLNRWRLLQFQQLWNHSGCELIRCDVTWVEPTHLRLVEEFPTAFQGRDLTIEDLLAQSLTVLLEKRW